MASRPWPMKAVLRCARPPARALAQAGRPATAVWAAHARRRRRKASARSAAAAHAVGDAPDRRRRRPGCCSAPTRVLRLGFAACCSAWSDGAEGRSHASCRRDQATRAAAVGLTRTTREQEARHRRARDTGGNPVSAHRWCAHVRARVARHNAQRRRSSLLHLFRRCLSRW